MNLLIESHRPGMQYTLSFTRELGDIIDESAAPVSLKMAEPEPKSSFLQRTKSAVKRKLSSSTSSKLSPSGRSLFSLSASKRGSKRQPAEPAQTTTPRTDDSHELGVSEADTRASGDGVPYPPVDGDADGSGTSWNKEWHIMDSAPKTPSQQLAGAGFPSPGDSPCPSLASCTVQ